MFRGVPDPVVQEPDPLAGCGRGSFCTTLTPVRATVWSDGV